MSDEEKLYFEIEKIIYKEILKLTQGKRALFNDVAYKVMLYFVSNLNESSERWMDFSLKIIKDAEDKKYVTLIQEPFQQHYDVIAKGLYFDEWTKKFKKNVSYAINIENVNADNLQLGNQNLINNSKDLITLQDFVQKIAESGDQLAIFRLRDLLDNLTVKRVLGDSVLSKLKASLDG